MAHRVAKNTGSMSLVLHNAAQPWSACDKSAEMMGELQVHAWIVFCLSGVDFIAPVMDEYIRKLRG